MESVFKALLESINAVLCPVGLLRGESYFWFTNITKHAAVISLLFVLLMSGGIMSKYLAACLSEFTVGAC